MKKFIYFSFVIGYLLSGISRAQWQPDFRLTNDPDTSFASDNNNAWCVAANGPVVHVVWYDYRDGNSEIYYKRSTDSGISWEADTRLTNAPSFSWNPSVSVSGSVVHVVWNDNRDGTWQIFYKRSLDGGIIWEADTQLTYNSGNVTFSPSISVSGSTVNVVWQDQRNPSWEIYYKRSTDGGVSWETDTRLTNNNSLKQLPSVSVSGSDVHVVWVDSRAGGGNYEIYYKSSTDGGVSWGADTRLTNHPGISWYPCVSASGSGVHVVWMESYSIYYKNSMDGGLTWGPEMQLGSGEHPSVSVSGSNVHIVWTGNNEIYYKYSTDGGTTWELDTQLTNDPSVSDNPSVAVSDSIVHVVWNDQRDGNDEIYYKRNPTGNVIPVELVSFTSSVSGSDITLSWTTATEINNAYFEIQKSYDGTAFNRIGTVSGYGTTTEVQHYNFEDNNLSVGTYYYRLKQIDYDGRFEYSKVIEAQIVFPLYVELVQNYPNPFNPSTQIEYSILKDGFVTLKVYNTLGQQVANLVDGFIRAGSHKVNFNIASGNRRISSGVYYYRLESDNKVLVKKMMVIK